MKKAHNKSVIIPFPFMMRVFRLLLLVAAFLVPRTCCLGQKSNADVLRQTLHFGERFNALPTDTMSTNVYLKYSINVVKRNATLATVPTMYYILRDRRRHYFSESYARATFNNGIHSEHRYIHLSTVYHRHTTLPSMIKYLTPRIYDENLFQDGILSPVNYHNRRYYRYKMMRNGDGTSTIFIRNKFRNTQLVRKGYMIVNDSTGQVLKFNFQVEYDMIHSSLDGVMNTAPDKLMFPSQCDVQAKLSFMGNKVMVRYASMYDLPVSLPDSIVDSRDTALMAKVRPVPLTEQERDIIKEYLDENNAKETARDSVERQDSIEGKKPKKQNWAKYVFWDLIGDNLLNKISTELGSRDKGQLRIGPIFNPFYFGYTKHKGVIYRLDLRCFYNFTDNHSISTRIKMGYSFKQHQFFYRIPVQWDFNKRRNGYVVFEFGNGNRISNSRVRDNVMEYGTNDSIDWKAMNLDYFKDKRLHLGVNYDVVKNYLGVQTGFTSHIRKAVDSEGFKAAGRPTVYKTFAPFLQLQYRPLSDRVPLVITTQWERGMKILGGSIDYDRFEFDGQYVCDLTRLRSWQLRTGFGFYTHKGHDDYFLDYHNFHEDYISLGWEDEWSGEFELLNSNWYNASDYYIRANATYESPLMLLSFCPLIGQIVEKERIYMSALAVNRMLPYVEVGYGFTNRVFSMGVFTGFSPGHFEGVGMKFGFELFNNY